MTKHREFKQLVRERMIRTGESYAAARAQLLAKAERRSIAYPGVLPGYDRFGGLQGNTAAVTNALRYAGVRSPLTGQPYSESEVNGLCGGPGFLYAVFEYQGMAPMLSLSLQSRSMADAFIANGLPRLGVEMTSSETTSAKAAAAALDSALAAGRAPLCTVDIATLPYYGLPKLYQGGASHVVTVCGRDDAGVWLDDRGAAPRHLAFDGFAAARARYRQAKHRLVTFGSPIPTFDPASALRDAVADTALRYTEPAVPKSFAGNCGFAGLAKWQAALTDRRDKKGWPTLFPDGALAFAGLSRAYECIEAGIAPGAGRGLYADFLGHAAAALGNPRLVASAGAWREAAVLWGDLANLITDCGDGAIREACDIAHRRLELGDAADDGTGSSAALWGRRHQLASGCRLTQEAAGALYDRMAAVVGNILAAERRAVGLMSA